jgi:hypothetical protein
MTVAVADGETIGEAEEDEEADGEVTLANGAGPEVFGLEAWGVRPDEVDPSPPEAACC